MKLDLAHYTWNSFLKGRMIQSCFSQVKSVLKIKQQHFVETVKPLRGCFGVQAIPALMESELDDEVSKRLFRSFLDAKNWNSV